MLHNLRFFSSKCRLFHNATFFGSCIIHILNTGVLKFKCKISASKVNVSKAMGISKLEIVRHRFAAAHLQQLWVRFLPGRAWIFLSYDFFMLSDRGLSAPG